MVSGITRFTSAAIVFCSALTALEVARSFDLPVTVGPFLAVANVTAVLAATVAVRQLSYIWRGPLIVAFRRSDGVLCDAREAEVVRSAAQLRGTMGGAGHFHRWRLVLSAGAWGAASAQSLMLLPPQRNAVTYLPLCALLLLWGLSAVLPAEPFFYREAAGGCLVAFPAALCRRLLAAAGTMPELSPIPLGAAAGLQAGAASGAAAREDEAPPADEASV